MLHIFEVSCLDSKQLTVLKKEKRKRNGIILKSLVYTKRKVLEKESHCVGKS